MYALFPTNNFFNPLKINPTEKSRMFLPRSANPTQQGIRRPNLKEPSINIKKKL
jgi:hypothetical protein